jgi:hypothetical protein
MITDQIRSTVYLIDPLGARNRVEVAMWAHETGRI